MLLEGSCHCGKVRFRVWSSHPYPFLLCYCSVCRKTAGGGGYAINIEADADSLEVEGRDHVKVYKAKIRSERTGELRRSSHERHFCGECGSALWAWHPRWPKLLHPMASAIDTPLPRPPERTHMMLDSRAPWVDVRAYAQDRRHPEYPDESLAEWHDRLGLTTEDRKP